MNIKNKKALAYFLIFIGIISLGFMVKIIIDKPERPIEDINSAKCEEEVESTTEESPSEIEKPGMEGTESSNAVATFDNITSILKYNINPEIEDLLNVEKFNDELTAFLLEKKAITDASHDTPSGIILCTSSDYLTKDLGRSIYLFDLKIDNADKSIVSVSVSGEEYDFDIR